MQGKDNTAALIRTGNLLVTLPTVTGLFLPVAILMVKKSAGSDFHFGYFAAAMLAGIALSFFIYRFASRRWLRWALSRATDLSALKRKAIQHSLVTEKGRSFVDTSVIVGDELSEQWDHINAQVALKDDAAIPAEKHYVRKTYYRLIAGLSLGMFLIALTCLLIFLKQPSAWNILNFSPLLLISLLFFFKKEKTTTVLTLNISGLSYERGFISWEEVATVRFVRKMAGPAGGFNRTTSSRPDTRSLFVRLTNGSTIHIPMNDIVVSHTIEDQIAVYRFRHRQLWVKEKTV